MHGRELERERAREKDDGKGVPDICKAYRYRAHFRLLDVLPHSHSTSQSHCCILSLSLSLSHTPSYPVPRADEEWVELLRDMDVERSGAVVRAASRRRNRN